MTRETVTVSGGARKTPRAPVSSGPAGSRRAANKAEVRRRVLRAARELFARRGPAGTTMDDVARLAEVSRATVFNHFSGKAEIVRELVAAFERGFRHAVDRQLCRTAPCRADPCGLRGHRAGDPARSGAVAVPDPRGRVGLRHGEGIGQGYGADVRGDRRTAGRRAPGGRCARGCVDRDAGRARRRDLHGDPAWLASLAALSARVPPRRGRARSG
ncbi:MAG: helix-turn-helix transcriptional regulator [Gammaproteobacteria bacterium]|nr:helix-turn-helix transcriptional regulator [Gammaproteobacteria bacterium]